MKTRAQEWSRRAFAAVLRQKGKDGAAKYRTACMKMPGLLHQSGLLQALVFETARDDLGERYVRDLAVAYYQDDQADAPRLIGEAQSAQLAGYLQLTRDVSAVAQWFVRFAQIELAEEDERA